MMKRLRFIRAALGLGLALAGALARAEEGGEVVYYGIRAKYASEAELATTNLAPGEIVVNEGDWTDVRIGDGRTPGGVRAGWTLPEERNALEEWGGARAEDIKALVALSVADQRALAEARATTQALHAASNALSGRFSDYLPLAGGTLEGDLDLHADSGDSPSLVFSRGTDTDNMTDWRVIDTGGNLVFQSRTYSTNWVDWATMNPATGGSLSAPAFSGNGNNLTVCGTNLNALATDSFARLGALEKAIARASNDTCTLFWRSQDLVTNATHAFDIPTDFPTPKLKIHAWTFGTTNASFNMPAWNPGRAVDIEFELGYSSDRSASNATSLKLMGTEAISRNTAQGFVWSLRFDPACGRWLTLGIVAVNGAGYQRNVAPDGSGATTGSAYVSDAAPATVAEWVALHPEWAEAHAALQGGQEEPQGP